MTERLLFRLAGPLASWGEIAVGEVRSSWPEPSKSAVLGLVAAALGVERADTARHGALHAGLEFAVRLDSRASPLRDYHTAQSPSARKGVKWATRADELSDAKGLNTILSERWYWQEFSATICLTPRDDGQQSLKELAEALRNPRFPLYLGRKSCPLGRPLNPAVLMVAEIAAAFTEYDALDAGAWTAAFEEMASKERPDLCPSGPAIWRDATGDGMARRRRRDSVRDRAVWTFDDRDEERIPYAAPKGNG